MMSSVLCYQKAQECELSAAESPEAVLRADFLQMARQWRLLGDDGTDQSTTARLMQQRRALEG
jgi:hypothetical protein